MKKIVYIDMDNVLVDFPSSFEFIDEKTKKEYEGRLDEVPHIFSKMKPIKSAIESFEILFNNFDVYILSTSPWENSTAWSDKLEWVKKHLPLAYKRLILSHNKQLNSGDYLIDDRLKNGVDRFEGEHIHFGNDDFRCWQSVVDYLLVKESKGFLVFEGEFYTDDSIIISSKKCSVCANYMEISIFEEDYEREIFKECNSCGNINKIFQKDMKDYRRESKFKSYIKKFSDDKSLINEDSLVLSIKENENILEFYREDETLLLVNNKIAKYITIKNIDFKNEIVTFEIDDFEYQTDFEEGYIILKEIGRFKKKFK
jgi:5'(3')-deoxyribonucleotidase